MIAYMRQVGKNARQMAVNAAQGILIVGFLTAAPAAFSQDKWVSLEKAGGINVFQEKCGMCHRAGGMGAGILARRLSAEQALLENRHDLEGAFIRTAVRNGFGVMFPISRAEVSDSQLETIIDYLAGEE